VILFVSLGATAWFERTFLLQGAANLWTVSDPITPADAVVVLGGGADIRPFVAGDLYAKGLVHKVLLSQMQEDRSGTIGVTPSDTDLNLSILRKLGVPDSAIELFGNGSKNTWDEVVALRDWTKMHATSVLIVPAEVFFARRLRWVLQREFLGTRVHVEVPSFDPPNAYRLKEWWKTGGGPITFRNEVLKYFYYRLRY
jgi:hypothetical protein